MRKIYFIWICFFLMNCSPKKNKAPVSTGNKPQDVSCVDSQNPDPSWLSYVNLNSTELPECKTNRLGMLVWQINPVGFQFCNGIEWVSLNIKGDKGDIGLTGPMGPQGSVGATGIQGEMGLIGLTGAIGPMGPMGPQGEPGEDGDTGRPGPQGPMGIPGSPGPMGAQGSSGSRSPLRATLTLIDGESTYQQKNDLCLQEIGARYNVASMYELWLFGGIKGKTFIVGDSNLSWGITTSGSSGGQSFYQLTSSSETKSSVLCIEKSSIMRVTKTSVESKSGGITETNLCRTEVGEDYRLINASEFSLLAPQVAGGYVNVGGEELAYGVGSNKKDLYYQMSTSEGAYPVLCIRKD